MALPTTPLIGKVAVVLGGTGDIGSATAHLFADAGARVAVVASRDRRRAETTAANLPGTGHHGYAAAIDRSDELTALAQAVSADLSRADILVNSAAVTIAVPHADLEAMDDESFDRILRVNTRGAFAAVRAFAPLLRAHSDGLVVNISSLSGSTGVGSCVAYCASKAALDVIGMSLARALAPAIRVLTISPGIVDTDFVPGRDKAMREKQGATSPLKRAATPQDCAEAVLACATALRFSTGSVIQVDGGRHL
jgi:3-oxoacyl-[acyl-carrier protein] reductase